MALDGPRRMGSRSHRPVRLRGDGRLLGCLRAGMGLPQTVDRLGQRGNLVRQPSRIRLLRRYQLPDGVQLLLHHLQLVD